MLREWIDEQREAESTRRRLENKATTWLDSEKKGGLLNAFDLQDAEQWRDGPDATELGVSDSLAQLMETSAAALTAQAAARRRNQMLAIAAVLLIVGLIIGALMINNRGQRDRIAIQNDAATQQAKDAAELAVRATAVAKAEIVAQDEATAALKAEANALAESQRADSEADVARKEAAIARARQLATQSESVADSELRLLLALEATDVMHSGGTLLPDVDSALRQALAIAPLASLRYEGDMDSTGRYRFLYNAAGDRLVAAIRAYDGTWRSPIRLIDTQTGHELAARNSNSNSNRYIQAAEFSDDGTYLAVTISNTVQIIDSTSGQELAKLAHPEEVGHIYFAPASSNPTVAVQSLTQPVVYLWQSLTQADPTILHHDEEIVDVDFTNSGKELQVITRSPQPSTNVPTQTLTIHTWNVLEEQEVSKLMLPYLSQIKGTEVIQNRSRLLVWTADRKHHLIDTNNGKTLATLDVGWEVPPKQVSPDETLWAVDDGAHIQLVNVSTGISTTLSHGAYAGAIAFNFDGTLLAAGDREGYVHIWDSRQGELLGEMHVDFSIGRIGLSSRGTYMYVVGDNGYELSLWRLPADWQRESPKQLNATRLNSLLWEVEFSPDGSQLLFHYRTPVLYRWDTSDGQESTWVIHDRSIQTLAFSPEGSRLVTGDRNGIVRLWQGQISGIEPEIIRLPEKPIYSNMWLAQNDQLLSETADGKLVLRSLPSAQQIGVWDEQIVWANT
ncbi:MAG TPA: hypothetical protein P5121_14390, partial [Caldilineaceae bacterium]|nr:hypothetical protein [Caldilineaceae bacterium]